jgi:hypothetical protein
MQSNEFSWYDESDEKSFLKHVLFYKCPYTVQRIIGDKTPKDFTSCASLAEALNHFVGTPPDIAASKGCERCRNCITCKGRKPLLDDRLGQKVKAPSKLFCDFHGSGSHEAKNCTRKLL